MPKKAKKMRRDGREDRLSALSDHLLHHILPFLVLKEVIANSVLSSRWRSLWTSVPNLHLSCYKKGIATSMSLSLMNYKGPKIRKFCANFAYEYITDRHIASWIRFAVDRIVEELHLLLDEPMHINHFGVLGCLLHCRSLVVLRLSGCELNLKASPLHLPLLTVLHLQLAILSDLDTSGCPALESLTLSECNSYEHLNIYAPNPRLRYLRITNFDIYSMITIFAPNVHYIQFEGRLWETCIIKDLSSLRNASLELEIGDLCGPEQIVGLLSVLHASTLKLNQSCILCLSRLEAGRELPPLRTICLELVISLEDSDLTGMSHVLKSAPHVKTLILSVDSSYQSLKDYYFDAYYLGNLWKSLFLSTAHPLKIVKVKFQDNILALFLKDPVPYLNVAEFLNEWEKEIKLLELLLNSCMVLEKMTISIERRRITKRPWPLRSELLLSLQNRVLSFPKSSSVAEICFSQN